MFKIILLTRCWSVYKLMASDVHGARIRIRVLRPTFRKTGSELIFQIRIRSSGMFAGDERGPGHQGPDRGEGQ